MKRLSVLDWYRVLRTRHQWTVFQAYPGVAFAVKGSN